jgi:acetolactate synthase-1/3 small subunit
VRRTFVLEAESRQDVLERIASVARRLLLRVESLVAAPALDPARTAITLVVDTDDRGARRLGANLRKIVDVVRVDQVHDAGNSCFESAVIRVPAGGSSREHCPPPESVFQGRAISAASGSVLLHVSGAAGTIDRLLELLAPLGNIGVTRSGAIALPQAGAACDQAADESDAHSPAAGDSFK